MLASSFLDTAIGIIFVFLLLSLIASSINEIILSLLNMRGRMLLDGIKVLLNDSDATGLVSQIYNHGQIFGLFKGGFNPGKTKSNLPSYIPTANFAMAFLGVLPDAAKKACEVASRRADDANKSAQQAKAESDKAGEDKTKNKKASDALAAAAAAEIHEEISRKGADEAQSALNIAAAAFQSSSQNKTPIGTEAELAMAFQSLKKVAIALSNNSDTEKVGKPLLTMLETAGNDFGKLTAGIESWYNSAMDRVSGWYKYRTQWILFAIGLVLAMLLNANTITIVRQLSTDATLRQSIVSAAQTAKPPESKSDQDLRNQYQQLGKEVAAVQNIGIPLGWAEGDSHHPVYYILGWLLTAIAISLGAPFWFDILNKFMVVRSTVKPQEKSREEGSKDKVKT